jgi:hypothetical protein
MASERGVTERGLTRRGLARRGAGVALAASSASLIGGVFAKPAGAQSGAFDDAVSSVIELENTLVVVYGAALRSGALSGSDRELATVFVKQSAEQAKLLQELQPGTVPPTRPQPSEVAGLGSVNNGRRYIEVAGNFENQAYLGYIDALDAATDRRAILLISQLAASTAQHLALLRQALGHVPAPSAFETGLSV